MTIRIPSRYEDLDLAFRGRLRPDVALIELVKKAYASMKINGGIRFIPIYGESGSGKSCAVFELSTHLPDCHIVELPRDAVQSKAKLDTFIEAEHNRLNGLQLKLDGEYMLVAVIDQYEEQVAERTAIPSQFVESISLLDRGPLRKWPTLFIWLTTSKGFQQALADSTRRNRRVLVQKDFELHGPPKEKWPEIIEETFSFHNERRILADYEILQEDLVEVSATNSTIGTSIEHIGNRLADYTRNLQDLSEYIVVMLWPVTDGHRKTRVSSFTDPRSGYRLAWNAWYRQLSLDDRQQLPLKAYNRARLYFDLRVVPVNAADLHKLCLELDDENRTLYPSYLSRFEKTHFFSIVSGNWDPSAYATLRERESKRADEAKDWYEGITRQPTKLGRRIARILRELGLDAEYEKDIESKHSKVRADIFVNRPSMQKSKVIVEIKSYNTENTRPSSIRDAIRTTLKRHAQFAGFLEVQ